ncbi:hypothetical protein SYJ56_24855 [Algoriphagus sp. D3-2-R+10]|uniref:hypothetical protein n=1 Tax=Algoriphagus aurantiacus TaxID=3103948 RepID=UPI002B3897A1|nr:hypothetical protein [Algoriphagus sp. D3-2-R+10]MEB2778562.1 hypothetical protein [Algoriphagus sp. D3-2-R+10]
MKILVGFLIVTFVSTSSFKLNAQSNMDMYRASTPVRVYDHIHLLTVQEELYTVEDQFAEIALMIKRFVEPYPGFTFQSKVTSKTVKSSSYRNDIAECIKSMETIRQIGAFASMLYFGEFIEYKPILDSLLSQLSKEDKYQYNDALDIVVTIQAASGFSELAEKQLSAMENVISGVKAEMHLAVTHSSSSNFELAEKYARSSFKKSENDLYKYERNRTFFQLCRNLGERKQIELAKELALLLNDEPDIAVAYGFIAKGANDSDLLRQAINMTSNFEVNKKNYVLKELGVLAAQSKQKELAIESYNNMNMSNLRQNAVRVLCEIARVYEDLSYLNKAYSITKQIPDRVYHAKSDATIWMAYSEVIINSNEDELGIVLYGLTKLEPRYQIKFDMNLLNIPSQRFHYKDSGY